MVNTIEAEAVVTTPRDILLQVLLASKGTSSMRTIRQVSPNIEEFALRMCRYLSTEIPDPLKTGTPLLFLCIRKGLIGAQAKLHAGADRDELFEHFVEGSMGPLPLLRFWDVTCVETAARWDPLEGGFIDWASGRGRILVAESQEAFCKRSVSRFRCSPRRLLVGELVH